MTRMPNGPVQTPGAWKGSELQQHADEWRYELTADDIGELRQAVARAGNQNLPLERISPKVFPLPRFGPKLHRFARSIEDGLGFVLMRGFPTTGLSLAEITLMYFGCMTYMGLPVAQNSKNALLDHVRDEGDPATHPRAYQSNKKLGYHSDSADMVSLFCVHPAKSGGLSRLMSAVSVHNIVQAERPDLLKVLYEQPYYHSWVGEEPRGQLPHYWAHFFSYYKGRLHTSSIKERYPDWPPMTPEQIEALDFVRHVMRSYESELKLDMDFRPGDVQVVDNSVVWHSRTAFEDDEDVEKRRHLLRVWLNYYTERPMAPDYWNRYEMVGQSTASPKRRLFDVEIYDTW